MNVLGIFVKHPVAGHVKTRLAEQVGGDRAAELYAAFIDDVADRFRASADRRFLCWSPENAAARDHFSQVAGSDYELWLQPGGSLGDRMAAFFRHSFAHHARRVVLIGSDSPTLPRRFVEDAFRLLADHHLVLGPATDGGYYLIGKNGPYSFPSQDIDWSSPRVLEQTVTGIREPETRLALLPPWYDVDTVDDLQLLRGHVLALRRAGEGVTLEKTESLLDWDIVSRPGSV